MKITCLIIEDEPMARKLLEQYVAKVPKLELAAAFASPLLALDYLQEHTVDLLFLDVQMPELTGIGLLKVLRERRPLVVLTTAYSEYAIEGYALDVADYLLKPITFERFVAAVERVGQRLEARPADGVDSDYLFVRDGTKLVRVALREIQYIEGMKDYVRIHTPERTVTTLQSLKHLVEVLPAAEFVRIHHSYIVGTEWLEEIHRDEVRVAGRMLTVSDTYRGQFKAFVARREL